MYILFYQETSGGDILKEPYARNEKQQLKTSFESHVTAGDVFILVYDAKHHNVYRVHDILTTKTYEVTAYHTDEMATVTVSANSPEEAKNLARDEFIAGNVTPVASIGWHILEPSEV
ncbi:MAG: hypothetical protein ACW96U_00910 [Candidatus Heimdallarchaeaceae archaeon]|jgi:hypothetical protein